MFAGIPFSTVDGCNFFLGVKFHLLNYVLVLISFYT